MAAGFVMAVVAIVFASSASAYTVNINAGYTPPVVMNTPVGVSDVASQVDVPDNVTDGGVEPDYPSEPAVPAGSIRPPLVFADPARVNPGLFNPVGGQIEAKPRINPNVVSMLEDCIKKTDEAYGEDEDAPLCDPEVLVDKSADDVAIKGNGGCSMMASAAGSDWMLAMFAATLFTLFLTRRNEK